VLPKVEDGSPRDVTGQYVTVTKSYAPGDWAAPLLVPASEYEPDVFRVISVTLGVMPVLWLTLYGVELVQVTETGTAAFALVTV
jgi:hypothetical protein